MEKEDQEEKGQEDILEIVREMLPVKYRDWSYFAWPSNEERVHPYLLEGDPAGKAPDDEIIKMEKEPVEFLYNGKRIQARYGYFWKMHWVIVEFGSDELHKYYKLYY